MEADNCPASQEATLAELFRQNTRLIAYNQLLRDVSQVIARADNETGLLQTFCELAVRVTGLRLAWIGQPDQTGRIRFLAKAGPAMHYLDDVFISIDPSVAEGQGSTGIVWREGKARFNNSFRNDPELSPWARRAASHGLGAIAVLPIRRHGQIWAQFALYAAEDEFFDTNLQDILTDLAQDISHGLEIVELRSWQTALLDHADAGIMLTRDNLLLHANNRMAEMLGFVDPGQLPEQIADIFCPPGTSDCQFGQYHQQLLAKGLTRFSATRLARRDGSSLEADLVGIRTNEHDAIWTVVDVSAREQQKAAFLQLQQLYSALAGAADILLQSRDETDMLQETCARLATSTMFHATWIGKPGPENQFSVLARAGEGATILDEISIPLDHPDAVIARAWRSQKTVFRNRHRETFNKEHPWFHAFRQHRWVASLATLIRRNDQPWAVLVFVAPMEDVFHAASIELCERIAGLLGRGLDEIDQRKVLLDLQSEDAWRARHDTLTGLANRFGLEEHLQQAIARSRRNKSSFAICMLDLDDFKPVNDTYGHEAGDELLKQFGARINVLLRDSDFIARLGGDEFIVVLADLDPLQIIQQTSLALSRMHQAVEQPFVLSRNRSAEINISAGLAFYPTDAEEPGQLLRLADAAMYQAKMQKSARVHWWRLSSGNAAPVAEPAYDPFGEEACHLLARLQPELNAIATDFMREFYDSLSQHTDWTAILSTLTRSEYETLKHRQTETLRFLVRPDTTASQIVDGARHPGLAHAMTGVSSASMNQAQQVYLDLLHHHLARLSITTSHRYLLLRTVSARIQLDVHTQLDTMQVVFESYNAHLAHPLDNTLTWSDQIQQELDALGSLPAMQACMIMRPGQDGVFVPEFAAGKAAQPVATLLRQPALTPRLNHDDPAGNNPVTLAWRTHQTQWTEANAMDMRTQDWHAGLAANGIRSLASIPVQVTGSQLVILVLFGAFPHQFSASWMQTFLESLRLRLISLTRNPQPEHEPIDEALAVQHRKLLQSGGLTMVMQPIIDLATGRLVKVEALARLRCEDGRLLAPASFLPSFGKAELEWLFRSGLDQSLRALSGWLWQGLEIDLSLNLAPSTLVHPDCPLWITDALQRHGIPASRLTLELLETEAFDDTAHNLAIGRLKQTGVQIGLDDLGAGYSSLNRLASLPFDIIKVDQGILCNIVDDPVKTLSLVHSILQLGRDFNRKVIIEGLENTGLIEAICLLGGRYGQGYGIARPMLAAELAAWEKQTVCQMSGDQPVATWQGALAQCWLYSHRPDIRHHSTPDECLLRPFLQQHAGHDTKILAWHDQIFGADPTSAGEAAGQLMNWLADRMRIVASGSGTG